MSRRRLSGDKVERDRPELGCSAPRREPTPESLMRAGAPLERPLSPAASHACTNIFARMLVSSTWPSSHRRRHRCCSIPRVETSRGPISGNPLNEEPPTYANRLHFFVLAVAFPSLFSYRACNAARARNPCTLPFKFPTRPVHRHSTAAPLHRLAHAGKRAARRSTSSPLVPNPWARVLAAPPAPAVRWSAPMGSCARLLYAI